MNKMIALSTFALALAAPLSGCSGVAGTTTGTSTSDRVVTADDVKRLAASESLQISLADGQTCHVDASRGPVDLSRVEVTSGIGTTPLVAVAAARGLDGSTSFDFGTGGGKPSDPRVHVVDRPVSCISHWTFEIPGPDGTPQYYKVACHCGTTDCWAEDP